MENNLCFTYEGIVHIIQKKLNKKKIAKKKEKKGKMQRIMKIGRDNRNVYEM